MTVDKVAYHHGDLRSALLQSAMRMLEEGEPFSLRAVAREAGVSPTAPYRHFADRDTLESALAAVGFEDLKADLMQDRDLPTSLDELAEFGVTYVDFALRRPALFRLMFGNQCDHANDRRIQAVQELRDLLALGVSSVFPQAEPVALASGGWALAHGLAFLHLDGKLAAASPEEVAEHVRAAFQAIFTARPSRAKRAR